MPVQFRVAASILLLGIVPACHCGKPKAPGSDVVVGKYDHGEVTAAESASSPLQAQR